MPAATSDIPVGENKLVRFGQETTNFIGVVLDFPNPDGVFTKDLQAPQKYMVRAIRWDGGRAVRCTAGCDH